MKIKIDNKIVEVDYQEALIFINQRGYDVETTLKARKGQKDLVICTLTKNEQPMYDKDGNKREVTFDFDQDFCQKVAERVCRLYLHLKDK